MSVITAGSPMVGTQINLVQELIRLGPIKDSWTFEMAKSQKERWLTVPVFCQSATTPTMQQTTYVACSSVLLDVV